MSATVVLVTGVPGSGKTTLARRLAPAGRAAAVPGRGQGDAVRPARGAGPGLVAGAALGGLEVVWSMLPDCPAGAVVDLWLDPDRDAGVAAHGLGRAGVWRVLEVLCEVPGEVAATRYAARHAGSGRHPGHLRPDEATLARIRRAAGHVAPLGLGPALRVD